MYRKTKGSFVLLAYLCKDKSQWIYKQFLKPNRQMVNVYFCMVVNSFSHDCDCL